MGLSWYVSQGTLDSAEAIRIMDSRKLFKIGHFKTALVARKTATGARLACFRAKPMEALRMVRRRTSLLILVCLAIWPGHTQAQLAGRLPEPFLSLRQLLDADRIVHGRVLSVELHERHDLPQQGVARVFLDLTGPHAFLKGGPQQWPTDDVVTLDLAIPTAGTIRKDDEVLWFLMDTPAGLETMGTTSGFFQVMWDVEHRYMARNLNGNQGLWRGENALWNLSDKPNKFKKDVETRIRDILRSHPTPIPEEMVEDLTSKWMSRGSAASSTGKLPKFLLVAVVQTYLNPTR